jgi:hypothetical protein
MSFRDEISSFEYLLRRNKKIALGEIQDRADKYTDVMRILLDFFCSGCKLVAKHIVPGSVATLWAVL